MSNERKPHKHAEVIKAWADGRQIQFDDDDRGWVDVLSNRPFWSEQTVYRVKPEPVKVRYRVALIRGSSEIPFYTITADEACSEKEVTDEYDFVRWLTGWIEVEVPQ